MGQSNKPFGLRLSEGLGPNAPTLTNEQVCNIGFAVLRAHNDDRLWRALTYDSGPYDLTTPNLALQQLGAAFYAAGAAAKNEALDALADEVEVSNDYRRQLEQVRAEYEDLQRHGNNTAHNLARMQAALAENASRSADHLRSAIKAEAEVARLRAALSEVFEVVSLQREPSWAYRNTITTNKDRIKAACRAGLGLD